MPPKVVTKVGSVFGALFFRTFLLILHVYVCISTRNRIVVCGVGVCLFPSPKVSFQKRALRAAVLYVA